ncbi:MAG: beta-galactosidase, partial [Anaerolineae bacterium]
MIYYGANYYPEEWSPERRVYDAQLMQQAGFNVVRLAELAWSLMEPEPDRFEFAWLDEIIALLHRHGVSTLLGTPTTVAPPWMVDLDPEVLLVWEDGTRSSYGYWSNYCFSSPVFRERARRIAEAMARHYADNPAVIGWQVDNEFGVMGRARCYCDRCHAAFQRWLKARYGTLEALRTAWGATFWSHEYSDWAQIPAPRKTTGRHNPGLLLDWARFCSERTYDFARLQCEILRALAPKQFLTHNFLNAQYTHLDNYRQAELFDIMAWDNYISFEHPQGAALSHDAFRSYKRRNFWILEQQCGHKFWAPFGELPRGAARKMSWQAVAHGADGVLYFRWRSGLIGTEQFHAGIIPHDGRPGRTYNELAGLGQELIKVGPALEGTTVPAQAALVLDYDSLWALEGQPHNEELRDPWRYAVEAYNDLLRRRIPVDFAPATADLSAYRLVIAPALYVLTPQAAQNLTRYVQQGGTLLLTVRTGEKDPHNRVVDVPFPGLLAELVGATVRKFDSRPAGEVTTVQCEPAWGAAEVGASTWLEWLEPEAAEVVARYREGLYAGEAAATWRSVGEGGVLYLGAMGEGITAQILGRLLARTGVEPPVQVEAPEAVEVCVRAGAGRQIVFLLNHSGEPQTARLGFAAQDLLAGAPAPAEQRLEPYGVRVLQVQT